MTTNKDPQPARARGRPPAFDRAEALDRAMQLFWEQGFEGASFDQLTGAMAISPSSFYNSFGSKEQLYIEATDAYMRASGDWYANSLFGAVNAREAFENLLEATARQFTGKGHPSGCMVSLAGTHLPPEFASVRQTMAAHRADSEELMKRRLRKGVEDGDLSSDVDVDAMAAFYNSVTRGMAVQARDGASLDKLLSIAHVAMQAWPARGARRRPAARD